MVEEALKLHFVDVGAHLGRTAQLLLNETKNPNLIVHLFEPNPIFASRLKSIFESEPRAIVYQEALDHKDSQALLRVPYGRRGMKSQGASISFKKKMKPNWKLRHLSIKTRSARRFIRGLSAGPVVLYSNCEGSEYDIVADLFLDNTWQRIALWSIEIHGPEKMENIDVELSTLKNLFSQHQIENIEGHWGRGEEQEEKLKRFLRIRVLPLLGDLLRKKL
jgi:FkbM family methyltransferase